MTAVQSLEKQVKQLSTAELREFREWFQGWDSDAWDWQIEQDAQAGKLDALAVEALAEYKTGTAKEI
jgi:succinate dehydrogenase flavin-adding protein (antitoxin of CptAB toxin-antitoxin module)